jgi:hypothetical protein
MRYSPSSRGRNSLPRGSFHQIAVSVFGSNPVPVRVMRVPGTGRKSSSWLDICPTLGSTSRYGSPSTGSARSGAGPSPASTSALAVSTSCSNSIAADHGHITRERGGNASGASRTSLTTSISAICQPRMKKTESTRGKTPVTGRLRSREQRYASQALTSQSRISTRNTRLTKAVRRSNARCSVGMKPSTRRPSSAMRQANIMTLVANAEKMRIPR